MRRTTPHRQPASAAHQGSGQRGAEASTITSTRHDYEHESRARHSCLRTSYFIRARVIRHYSLPPDGVASCRQRTAANRRAGSRTAPPTERKPAVRTGDLAKADLWAARNAANRRTGFQAVRLIAARNVPPSETVGLGRPTYGLRVLRPTGGRASKPVRSYCRTECVAIRDGRPWKADLRLAFAVDVGRASKPVRSYCRTECVACRRRPTRSVLRPTVGRASKPVRSSLPHCGRPWKADLRERNPHCPR